MEKRKSIGNKKRFDVFKRDLFCCQYCGSNPPKVVLEVDHITPVSKGGNNDLNNLITSCFNCNRGKRDHLLTTILQSLQSRAQEIKEREAQIDGYKKVMEDKDERLTTEAWQIANILIDNSSVTGFNKNWYLSLKRFLDLLNFYEVVSAAEIATSRGFYDESKMFRYFCAICWNKIRDNDNG